MIAVNYILKRCEFLISKLPNTFPNQFCRNRNFFSNKKKKKITTQPNFFFCILGLLQFPIFPSEVTTDNVYVPLAELLNLTRYDPVGFFDKSFCAFSVLRNPKNHLLRTRRESYFKMRRLLQLFFFFTLGIRLRWFLPWPTRIGLKQCHDNLRKFVKVGTIVEISSTWQVRHFRISLKSEKFVFRYFSAKIPNLKKTFA